MLLRSVAILASPQKSGRTKSGGDRPAAAVTAERPRRIPAANEITASICAVDGDRPAAVCESRGVLAADQELKITSPH